MLILSVCSENYMLCPTHFLDQSAFPFLRYCHDVLELHTMPATTYMSIPDMDSTHTKDLCTIYNLSLWQRWSKGQCNSHKTS